MGQFVQVAVGQVEGEVELRVRFASVEQATAAFGQHLRVTLTPPPTPDPARAEPAAPPATAPPSPPLNRIEAGVLDALRAGPLTGRALRDRLGLTQNQERRALEGLRAQGLVERDGAGGRLDPFRYRLTAEGARRAQERGGPGDPPPVADGD